MAEIRDIDILGSTYQIIYVESEEERNKDYPHLIGCYGILLSTSKTILIQDYDIEIVKYTDEEGGFERNWKPLMKSSLRHEIIHAYLNECGLRFCAKGTNDESWSRNEEMVDWIACLSPKIFKTFKELDILDE